MTLVVRQEHDLSYDETAAMAADGFGMPPGTFKPERLRWLYERAFSSGTTVLSLYAQDRKVGQVALVHQSVWLEDKLETAIALVDLFILKDFRSRQAIADLYGEVERFCESAGVRFILAVPNAKGAKVNVRYLRLAEFLTLDIRAGLCLPWRARDIDVCATLETIGQEAAVRLFARFLPSDVSGLFWTPETLWERLQNGDASYGVTTTESVMLVSSPRTSRGLPHTLVCAIFAKPDAGVTTREVARVARAACALHRRPFFIYAGVNSAIPLPGVSLPTRLRPSAMMVQIRDFQPSGTPVAFGRFELLDFDFA